VRTVCSSAAPTLDVGECSVKLGSERLGLEQRVDRVVSSCLELVRRICQTRSDRAADFRLLLGAAALHLLGAARGDQIRWIHADNHAEAPARFGRHRARVAHKAAGFRALTLQSQMSGEPCGRSRQPS
jgi:hypothetical protein